METPDLREATLVTGQALAVCTSPGKSSQDPSNFSWTRDGFRLLESRRDLEKLAQEIQRATPPLTNLQLFNPKIGRFFGGTVLSRGMDFDTFQNIRRAATGVKDTLGHICAHLSQVM